MTGRGAMSGEQAARFLEGKVASGTIVATRRLWNYLAWFKWIWSFRRGRTAEQTAVLVVKQVGASPYKTTWRNYKRTPYPFYDYWVKQAKWDWRARAALPLAMGTVSKAG
jgi:hypothetical protein